MWYVRNNWRVYKGTRIMWQRYESRVIRASIINLIDFMRLYPHSGKRTKIVLTLVTVIFIDVPTTGSIHYNYTGWWFNRAPNIEIFF